jgi:hypothetical protein
MEVRNELRTQKYKKRLPTITSDSKRSSGRVRKATRKLD